MMLWASFDNIMFLSVLNKRGVLLLKCHSGDKLVYFAFSIILLLNEGGEVERDREEICQITSSSSRLPCCPIQLQIDPLNLLGLFSSLSVSLSLSFPLSLFQSFYMLYILIYFSVFVLSSSI